MNGRVYDPKIGRFLSKDPIVHVGLSQSPNSYSYVWNNPLRWVDPSGYDPTPPVFEDIDVRGRRMQLPLLWDACAWGGPSVAGCTWDLWRGWQEVPYFYDEDWGGGDDTSSPEPPGPEPGAKEEASETAPCDAGARRPMSPREANRLFRNNTDPALTVRIDASALRVRPTQSFDSRGRTTAVVQGWPRLVHGSVTLVRGENGDIRIAPERYDFELHDISRYDSSWYGAGRNFETLVGFYVATGLGITELWASLTDATLATDFVFEFACSPVISP